MQRSAKRTLRGYKLPETDRRPSASAPGSAWNLKCPWFDARILLRAILPSTHEDNDADDPSGDSRHNRGENRIRPHLLPIDQGQKDKRYHRHAEHHISAANCRPD